MPSYVLPTLLIGSRGENVRKLQQYLRTLGQQLAIDGVFGPETRQAVLNFQAQAGVPRDGIVGERTWRAIEVNLGANVDVYEELNEDDIPEVPGGEPPSGGLTPGKLVGGALLLAGVAGLLLKRSKK